jgi:hypothetical protein
MSDLFSANFGAVNACIWPPAARCGQRPESGRDPWQPTASNCELRLDQIDQLNLGVSQIEYYLQSAELEVVT